MIRISPLADQPPEAVEALLDAAFGTDRHGRTAYRIRDGMSALPDFSFAAIDEQGGLVGTLQSWPIALNSAEASVPLIMVGPVAVQPDQQQQGIGKMLMQFLVREAYARKCAPLMLIGDPEYYGRFFGFSAEATGEWGVPGPVERHRLLALSVDGRALPRIGLLGPRT